MPLLSWNTLGLASVNDVKRASECTTILNGIEVCTKPKHEVVSIPRFNPGNLIDPNAKQCINLDLGRRGMPENYICFNGEQTVQYFEAIVPYPAQREVEEMLRSSDMRDVLGRLNAFL